MMTRPGNSRSPSRVAALAVALAVLVAALPVAAQAPALVAGPQLPREERASRAHSCPSSPVGVAAPALA